MRNLHTKSTPERPILKSERSQSKWLCNVLILKLDKCTLPYAIPSSILTCLKNLRELEVRDSDKVVSSCHHLTTLVHSAVSFCNLKQLSVKDCHGLKHLFTSSAARKLVHLEEMYIVQCESMEEILAEEQEETTSGAIKFERLSTIILDSLSSLLCFYSGSSTLLLSTLIRVLIWKCPNMKTFSRGDIHAESFLGIQGSLDTKEKLIFHQDLNSTVEQMFQQQVRTLNQLIITQVIL
uniref:Disease resistance protein At4g27190-like leucine-rich repeats domain-containing protein n=1 Tax=Cajanus cajan TaxID=3821 RepID=A0A151SHS8_CAJCA|nr:hypothetical protein KK1_000500 [Cajanus cajan]